MRRWEDFPSTNATINASVRNAFKEYQRGLVTEFLVWQAGLVRAHARPDQFVTQNFDYEWRGYSFGIQPDVDHWRAGRVLDVAGVKRLVRGHDAEAEKTGERGRAGRDIPQRKRKTDRRWRTPTEAYAALDRIVKKSRSGSRD